MKIVGQKKPISIITSIIKNSDDYLHFLLVAPSGHGKSLIGRFASNLLALKRGKRIIHFSTGDRLYELVTNMPKFKFGDYIIFVDEIHTLVNPEVIFPLFEKTDIIATTNIMGLPEALENRFTMIPLDRYNEKELKEIFELYYGNKISEEEMEKFLKISRTPRKLKNFATLYKSLGEDFWELVVSPEGLTGEEVEYINALKQLGGQSSFSRIRALLGYSPKYVQQIEVQLISKGIIEITSKGRRLKEHG